MSVFTRLGDRADTPAPPDVAAVVEVVAAVRRTAPLVQCITNSVVTGFTANMLLAAGASPAMVDIAGEAGPFAKVASAVLVNLGTPNPEQRDAAREAVRAATDAGTPWVLDPVAVGSLPVRTGLAVELVARRPTVIRGNASEIIALTGGAASCRGVDATVGTDDAVPAAKRLAATGTGAGAVAISGPSDVITDGSRVVVLTGGHPMLTRVTGTGCVFGALIAACTAVTDDALLAAVAGSAWLGAAAERATADRPGARRAVIRSVGPGSFAVALIDEIAALTLDMLAERVRLS